MKLVQKTPSKSILITVIAFLTVLPLSSHLTLPSSIPQIGDASATVMTALGIWSDSYMSRSVVDSGIQNNGKFSVEVNVTNAGPPNVNQKLNGFDVVIEVDETVIIPVDQNPTQTGIQPAKFTGGLFSNAELFLANDFFPNGTMRVAAIDLQEVPSASGTLFFMEIEAQTNAGESEIDILEPKTFLTNPARVAYVSLDGFFSNKGTVNEVSVQSIIVSSEQVPKGDSVTISVVVGNLGTATQSVTVAVKANETITIGSQPVSITQKTTSLVTFIWDTSSPSVSPGLYRLNATATVLGDVFLKDNSLAIEQVTVVVIDLAVTSVVPSSTNIAKKPSGEQFEPVKVNVTNQGTITTRANVTAYVNKTLANQMVIGVPQSLDIPAGATQTFTFQWNITATIVGNHIVSAEVKVVSGEKDTADNSLTDGTVRVFVAAKDVGITTILTSNTNVAVGENATFSLTLVNTGTSDETFVVKLFANNTKVVEKTEFLASSSDATVTYRWNTTGQAPAVYVIKGNTTLAGDENSANDEYTDGMVRLFVNRVPTVTFQLSPAVPNPGQAVTFDGSGTDDPDRADFGDLVLLVWDFGDGSPTETRAVTIKVTHAYLQSGTYTVRLTANDSHGGSSSTTRTLRVNAKPTASFSFSPSSTEAGREVSFDASSSVDTDGTVASYTWDFGDGTTGIGREITHKFTKGGTYSVKLTVTDTDGLSSDTITKTIVVSEPSFFAGPLPLVIGGAAAAAAVGVGFYFLRRKKP